MMILTTWMNTSMNNNNFGSFRLKTYEHPSAIKRQLGQTWNRLVALMSFQASDSDGQWASAFVASAPSRTDEQKECDAKVAA